MSDREEGTPMKHPKSASSVEMQEAPITTPFPDRPSSMQAYHGGAAPAAFDASTVGSPTPHPYMWRSQHHLMPPYGIPIPYPALFPQGGFFAHPTVPTAPNLAPSGEVGRGISDGKGRTSAKKFKGASGSTSFVVDKGAENQKTASSSDNDDPSLSSDNGVDGSLEVRSNPLNVAASGAMVVHDSVMPDKWVHDERELKRQKRKQSNRESARRSRLRKQAECEELQERVDTLNNQNYMLKNELQRISEACEKLTSENHSIKEELLRTCEPEDLTRLQEEIKRSCSGP